MTRLGGFIITFNRPNRLIQTISSLNTQTIKLDFIWIIDNSTNGDTEEAIIQLGDSRIKYFNVGYNAGPAGAAKIGLTLCAKEKIDWIFWGDDDDPPLFRSTFEQLTNIIENDNSIGIVGTVGHYFDYKRGIIKRSYTNQLTGAGGLAVDTVAGGMTMIVNKRVVEKNILPDPLLFFGFEELDFCINVKNNGFKIIVDKEIFLRLRRYHDRESLKKEVYKRKTKYALIREYYSTRNLLYISKKYAFREMKYRLLLKWSIKIIYGFRYGISYGVDNTKMICLGTIHYFFNKMGYTINLKDKD